MQKSKSILDANILTRYLLNDNKLQVKSIEKLITKAGPGELFIPDVVLVEVFYVLKSFYKYSKSELIEALVFIIEFDKFDTNYRLMKDVVRIFSENNISFVDAYIAAMTLRESYSKIYTFDEDLLKVQEIEAEKP